MSLSNLKTNFNLDLANPTYQGERNFLIKVAENNPLRLYPNDPKNLKPHLDSNDRLAIGYGYDLEKNKTNVVADFAKIGITLARRMR